MKKIKEIWKDTCYHMNQTYYEDEMYMKHSCLQKTVYTIQKFKYTYKISNYYIQSVKSDRRGTF